MAPGNHSRKNPTADKVPRFTPFHWEKHFHCNYQRPFDPTVRKELFISHTSLVSVLSTHLWFYECVMLEVGKNMPLRGVPLRRCVAQELVSSFTAACQLKILALDSEVGGRNSHRDGEECLRNVTCLSFSPQVYRLEASLEVCGEVSEPNKSPSTCFVCQSNSQGACLRNSINFVMSWTGC